MRSTTVAGDWSFRLGSAHNHCRSRQLSRSPNHDFTHAIAIVPVVIQELCPFRFGDGRQKLVSAAVRELPANVRQPAGCLSVAKVAR